MLFAGIKLNNQVFSGNLSASILKFGMEMFLLNTKFAAAILLRCQVVSYVSRLMFLDPPEYSPDQRVLVWNQQSSQKFAARQFIVD